MDGKAVVDSDKEEAVDRAQLNYQNELAMVKNECSLLCDKLVEDLKPLINLTKDELMASVLDLQPRVTRELELTEQELAEKEKKLAENNHELAALKAKLQDPLRSHS